MSQGCLEEEDTWWDEAHALDITLEGELGDDR
jgi:hypothetical protein